MMTSRPVSISRPTRLLALLAFAVCFGLGFKFSEALWPQIAPLLPDLAFLRPAPAQYSVVLIHVDTLEKEQPEMLSAWLIVIQYGNSPIVWFEPLYPGRLDREFADQLQATSGVDGRGQLSDVFVQALEQLELSSENALVLDDDGLAQWMRSYEGQRIGTPPALQQRPADVLNHEGEFLQGFCQNVSSEDFLMRVRQLPQIDPSHVRIALDENELADVWGRLKQGSVVCKVNR